MTAAHDILTAVGLTRFVAFLKESDQIEGILIPDREYENALMLNSTTDADHQYTYPEDHVWALSYVLKHFRELPKVLDVLEIHRRLMANAKLSAHHIGQFRRTDVMVGGDICPNPASIPYLIDDWVWRLNQESMPDALDYHREYELIHPFVDGNGRSGRLLWLWLRLHNNESIGPFLQTAGYEGNDFEQKRQNYYKDLKTKKIFNQVISIIGNNQKQI